VRRRVAARMVVTRRRGVRVVAVRRVLARPNFVVRSVASKVVEVRRRVVVRRAVLWRKVAVRKNKRKKVVVR
jgi:hypothetical protein